MEDVVMEENNQVPEVDAPNLAMGVVQPLPPIHNHHPNITEQQKWRIVAEYGLRTYGDGKITEEKLLEVALLANVSTTTIKRVWREFKGKRDTPWDTDISLKPLNFGRCGIHNRKPNEADIKGTIQWIVDNDSDGGFISYADINARLRAVYGFATSETTIRRYAKEMHLIELSNWLKPTLTDA